MRILLFFVTCLILSGCFTQGDCLVSATNLMRIQFKKKNTKSDTSVSITYVSFSGTDSILAPTTAVTELILPVDGHVDSTRFIFHRVKASDNSITGVDTLTVKYDIQSSVATPDCGAYTYYQNLKVVKFSRGDSLIKVFNKSLAKDPTSQTYAINFWIYF
jgi:hypothetical protein